MNEFAPGVACLPVNIVNAYFVGQPGRPWALVDTGLPGFLPQLRSAAAGRYGADSRPAAIFLTHGHFDHAGNARAFAEEWGVPTYAHALEMPYLTGRSNYPPKDPTVGGAMAFLSRLFPARTVDLGEHLQPLPADGTLPGLPEWRWLHTPGHAPGHVSFFRDSDRTLLAGDALATMNVDSFQALLTRVPSVSRPPAPFDYDWDACRESVAKLAALRPAALGAGHGMPMTGTNLPDELARFAAQFPVPRRGRYVGTPARADETGVVFLPPAAPDPLPLRCAVGAGIVLAAWALRRRRRGA